MVLGMEEITLMGAEAPFTDGKNIRLLTTNTKNSGINRRVILAIVFIVFFV
jgi:hypothetical protein